MANFTLSTTATYELMQLINVNSGCGPCCGLPFDEAVICVHEPGKEDEQLYLYVMEAIDGEDEDECECECECGEDECECECKCECGEDGEEYDDDDYVPRLHFSLTSDEVDSEEWTNESLLAEYSEKAIYETPLADIAHKLAKFYAGESED